MPADFFFLPCLHVLSLCSIASLYPWLTETLYLYVNIGRQLRPREKQLHSSFSFFFRSSFVWFRCMFHSLISKQLTMSTSRPTLILERKLNVYMRSTNVSIKWILIAFHSYLFFWLHITVLPPISMANKNDADRVAVHRNSTTKTEITLARMKRMQCAINGNFARAHMKFNAFSFQSSLSHFHLGPRRWHVNWNKFDSHLLSILLHVVHMLANSLRWKRKQFEILKCGFHAIKRYGKRCVW